jgi:hypothetical protein
MGLEIEERHNSKSRTTEHIEEYLRYPYGQSATKCVVMSHKSFSAGVAHRCARRPRLEGLLAPEKTKARGQSYE